MSMLTIVLITLVFSFVRGAPVTHTNDGEDDQDTNVFGIEADPGETFLSLEVMDEVEANSTENDFQGEDEDPFQPIPMPTDFRSYDILPRDGHITLEELVKATGAIENVDLAFVASDADGDGKLTPEEFYLAPWALQGDPELKHQENVMESEGLNQGKLVDNQAIDLERK